MSEKPDWTGRRLRLEVGPVAHGGHCVARHEGRVVFVRHSLPGETVEAEVTEDRGGGFCRADAVRIVQPAAGRTAPPCPLADIERGTDRCGGCDWQHADEATQRELKSSVVTEQLWRLAGIDYPVEVHSLPGGPLRWRSRVRMAVDGNGRAGFRAHRSHRVIPVDDCPITLPGTLDEVTAQEWSPGSEVEVAEDTAGEVHITAHGGTRRRGNTAHGYRTGRGNRAGRGGNRVRTQSSHLLRGSGIAHEEAAGRSWELAAHGFWQIHPAAAEEFAATVGRMARAPLGGCAWDLYGGVGLFASVLAGQVGPEGSVSVVESGPRAVADARANLADLTQVRVHGGAVEKVLNAGSLSEPDVVVLDPPRKGAGRAVVDALAQARPDRVVYVACDPAALARDLGLLVERGYRVAEIRAFDAFPMTHHVESIALLEHHAGQ